MANLRFTASTKYLQIYFSCSLFKIIKLSDLSNQTMCLFIKNAYYNNCRTVNYDYFCYLKCATSTGASQKYSKTFILQSCKHYRLCYGVGSVIAIKNKSFKWHKYLAYASGALALAHIGLIEWFHNKKKNSNNNVN